MPKLTSCQSKLTPAQTVVSISKDWIAYIGIDYAIQSRQQTTPSHEESHSYTLKCPDCGQYFNRKDSMIHHRLIHTFRLPSYTGRTRT